MGSEVSIVVRFISGMLHQAYWSREIIILRLSLSLDLIDVAANFHVQTSQGIVKFTIMAVTEEVFL